MCKKLIFLLAMAAMVSTAFAVSADGSYQPDVYPGDGVILKVDIDAQGTYAPNDLQPGWTSWEMPAYYGSYGPILKNFGGGKICQLDGITKTGGSGNFGGSRDRISGPTGPYANDFGEMLGDLAYVPHTAAGCGVDYIKLTIRLGAAYADFNVDVSVWSWDPAFKGSGLPSYGGAGEQEGSKRGAWSATDPTSILTDPNGYGYGVDDPLNYVYGVTDTNMPAALRAVTSISPMNSTAPWLSELDGATGVTNASTVNVTLDSNGQCIIYGWADMLTGTGSQHIAINGFTVTLPEPTTIALLGLGGLALIRRKR